MFSLGPFNFHFGTPKPNEEALGFIVCWEYIIHDSPRVKTLEGFKLVYQLKDNHGLKLKLQGKSKHGNPVDFTNEQIEATSSDPAVIVVTEDEGFIRVEPIGVIGVAQVQVAVPSILIDGTPLSGMFDVEIVAGDAATIAFAPIETFETGETDPVPVDPNVPV